MASMLLTEYWNSFLHKMIDILYLLVLNPTLGTSGTYLHLWKGTPEEPIFNCANIFSTVMWVLFLVIYDSFSIYKYISKNRLL